MFEFVVSIVLLQQASSCAAIRLEVGYSNRIQFEPKSWLGSLELSLIQRILANDRGPRFQGGSQSKVTAACAGVPYLLKLPTLDTPRVTFNELLGVIVAALADVRTAPCALVAVPSGLLPIKDGEYFGSRILDDHSPLDQSYVRNGLSEKRRDELYYLLVVDLLMLNNDRKPCDLLRRGAEPLIAVDHGNALSGANWTAEHLGKCRDSGIDVNDRRVIYCSLIEQEHARRAAQRLIAKVACTLRGGLDALRSVVPVDEAEGEAVGAILEYRLKNLERLAVRQVQDYARAMGS